MGLTFLKRCLLRACLFLKWSRRLEVSCGIKRCPKCGNEIVRTDYLSGYGAVRLVKFGDVRGDKKLFLLTAKTVDILNSIMRKT